MVGAPSAGQMGHIGAPARSARGDQRVVDLEELRQLRATSQAKHPDQPSPAGGTGGGYRVVVEPAGQEDLMRRGLKFRQKVVRAALPAQHSAEVALAETALTRSLRDVV